MESRPHSVVDVCEPITNRGGVPAPHPRLSFGPYVIEGLLGTGGMAVVHIVRRARGRDIGERFAMKRILPELARSETLVRMFGEEARLGLRLRHPNVVRAVDFGDQDGDLALVTEHVEGTSCARLLAATAAAKTSFPVDVSLFIATEVLEGLEYTHAARGDDGTPLGIVHRDVSPGNILLGAMGAVKLADFGVACSNDHRSTHGRTLHGKPGYMSPEQIRGLPVDHRSDLFSLAIVLFEAVSGRPFFVAHDDVELVTKMRTAPLSPLSAPEAMWLPFELRLILATALSRDPGERFSSATEFGDALRGVARRSGMRLGPGNLIRWLRKFKVWPSPSGTYAAVRNTDAGRGPASA